MRFQFYRTGESVFYWRLLGRNHRILAVAPGGFGDTREAESAVIAIKANAARAAIDLTSDRGVAWRWQMRDPDGAVVALSAHAYGRRIEAQAGAGRFRRGVAQAAVDTRLLVFEQVDDLANPPPETRISRWRSRRATRAETSGLQEKRART